VQPVTAFNLALEAWWMAAVSAEMHVRKRPGKAADASSSRGHRPPFERTSDALWPWAAPLQPASAWLRTAGYLVDADRGGGSVRPPGSLGGGSSFRQ
jgi:hypothetical protein